MTPHLENIKPITLEEYREKMDELRIAYPYKPSSLLTTEEYKKWNREKSKDWNREFKLACLAYYGSNSCSRCGYDKCLRSLHFHHKDRKSKTMNVSGMCKALPLIKSVTDEIDKCDLLCSNCHYEIEANITDDINIDIYLAANG